MYIHSETHLTLSLSSSRSTIFISNLLDQNCSFSVISALFYAIKWVHNINNFVDATENGFVKSMLVAVKRLRSQTVMEKML